MEGMEGIFLGVMNLQEAKNHQHTLKSQGVHIELKVNDQTCQTGSCNVTVEVWGKESDKDMLMQHFQGDFMKHVKGHVPNFEHMQAVFDPTMAEVVCQACGAKFSPAATECPDCGLCY
jgi:ribosomal protein L40E